MRLSLIPGKRKGRTIGCPETKGKAVLSFHNAKHGRKEPGEGRHLLDLNVGPQFGKLLTNLFGFFLGDFFLDGLRGFIDQFFSFF